MLTVFLLFCAGTVGFLAGIIYCDSELKDEFFVSGPAGDTFMVGPFRTEEGAHHYGNSCYSEGKFRVCVKKVKTTIYHYV